MSVFDVFRIRKEIPAPWEKYYSKEELNFEIPDISMYEQIRLSAIRYSDMNAIEYMGRNIKYKQLLSKINLASQSLYHLGVRKGDIVTICMPNVPEALICVYALNRIGAIANMVHPLSSGEEIKETLVSTKSKILFMMDMFYSKIVDVIDSTLVEKVVFASCGDSMKIPMKFGYKIINARKHSYPSSNRFISFKKFMKYGYMSFREFHSFGKDTPAVILHSGGTSGKPKNVVIQNRAFIMGAIQENIALSNLCPGDSCLAIMPNFHGFGLSVSMHTPLVIGCCSMLIPQFDSKKFDTLFMKKRPSCVLGVPTLYEALISNNNEKKLDLSFLKYVICGGDSLGKKLEGSVNEFLKNHNCDAKIVQGYGMSEALAAVCLNNRAAIRSGSIGIPLPGNYIKIINSSREIVPYGEIGEIVINSRALMMGYLNNEHETNEALQVHSDGHVWLHTGDLGYMDEDGFVFYKGRNKRMIISSGYNIYPSHIEEIIEKHPLVLQCSVVGVPHPYKQEVPKAFIVLKDGHVPLFVKSDIKKHCNKYLSKYMIPRYFVFRKKLPKTKLGKVDFVALQNDKEGSDYE